MLHDSHSKGNKQCPTQTRGDPQSESDVDTHHIYRHCCGLTWIFFLAKLTVLLVIETGLFSTIDARQQFCVTRWATACHPYSSILNCGNIPADFVQN